MQLENFEVIESIAIKYSDCYLDLHNNFDFVGLTYYASERCVELDWQKSSGKWAAGEKYKKLKMIFDFVSVFSISPRNNEKPFSEDNCLNYIGYLHPDDIDIMEGFLTQEYSEKNYHLVLGFESGLVIKLYSENARLNVL